MTTNFSNTITLSVVHALCVNKSTHAPVAVDVTIPYAVDANTAVKPVRKVLSARSDVAFAMVVGVDVKNVLCTLPIDVFTAHAVKLSRRGENGRTREPVMTRTIETSIVHALCVNKSTHAPVTVDVTIPYAVDVDAAVKPVRKVLSARSDVAFAMVVGVDVETAVYEMTVAEYVQLCYEFGTVEEKNA